MKRTIEILGNSGQYILTAVQTNEILQIVELIISILTSLFILGINIYAWYKKAKADGKITSDEISEGAEIIKNGLEEIKDKTDKGE